jgi:hypothetical protein
MKYNDLTIDELMNLCIDRKMIGCEFMNKKKEFIDRLKYDDKLNTMIKKKGYDKMNLVELRLLMKERGSYFPSLDEEAIRKYLADNDIMKEKQKKLEQKSKQQQKQFLDKTKFELRQSSKYHTYEDIKDEFEYVLPTKKNHKKFLQPILADEIQADLGNFPKNISHVYWAYTNSDWESGTEYYLFCKLDNGNYVFFEATGCGTCEWGVGENDRLYVSSNPEHILKYAMHRSIYKKYVKETK